MQPTADYRELTDLLTLLCDGEFSQTDLDRLERILLDDPDAQRYYARFLALDEELAWSVAGPSSPAIGALCPSRPGDDLNDDTCFDEAVIAETPLPTNRVPADLGGPGALPFSVPVGQGAAHGMSGYFASGWPVAYLVATVIFALGLAIGAIVHVSGPGAYVDRSNSIRTPDSPSPVPTPSSVVGRIAGMADCVWEDVGWGKRSAAPPQNSLLNLGDRLVLRSGLLEITYDTGAKVILQGPVQYEVDSVAGGFLSLGKLTAKLDSESEISHLKSQISNQKSEIRNHTFAVRTPTAVVTDLGTEFGVEVDKAGRTTSHVFRGKVNVQATGSDGKPTDAQRVLHAGESVKVNAVGQSRIALLDRSAATGFARQLPKNPDKKSASFELVASWQFDGQDFLADSSGHGHALVNRGVKQVDGTASFDGKAIMSTVDSVDLTPYKKIRVSWSQKAASLASEQVIWEQSSDYIYVDGAIIAYLSDGKGNAGIRTTDDKDGYNVDQYPVHKDAWEHISVEYDRTAYRAGVVRVFKDGTQIAATALQDGFAPDAFAKAVFHIGARDRLINPFVGQIDDLKIEGKRGNK